MAKSLSPFGQAFKEARERGDTTFEFNGKKYTTELAGEKKAAATSAPAPRKVAPPPAEEEAETSVSRRTTSMPSGSLMGRISRSQGAESTFPEPKNEPVGERAAAQRQETMDMFSRMGRKLGKYLGTESTRQRIRDEEAAEGMKKGGKVGSASRRGDGIAQRGKTRGTMVMCKGGMYK